MPSSVVLRFYPRAVVEGCVTAACSTTFHHRAGDGRRDRVIRSSDLSRKRTPRIVIRCCYASCALPGFYPPGAIGGRLCVDGGVLDNLPVSIAGRGMDAVIAVDTGSSDLEPENDIATAGFASIYVRAATTMMHALQLAPFATWTRPPMILIRPKVNHIGWFSFSHTDELLDAGYTAAMEACKHYEECITWGLGVFPRRPMQIAVDREKCIGCTLCTALAPDVMAMDAHGKAYPLTPVVEWSPADGDFVHHCPTYAIEATRLEMGGTHEDKTTVDPTSEPTTKAG